MSSASSSPATTTPPNNVLFPPPQLFQHHLIRHPPPPPPPSLYPTPQPANPAWAMAPPQYQNQGEVQQRRSEAGQIDCALSLLSSGTRMQGQQQQMGWQQQGFDGGACGASASASHGGGGCYGFEDEDSDGGPSRMYPFSWD